MPPQDTNTPQQPGQFDFILKDGPKPPSSSLFSGLPRPVILVGGFSVILIIGILLWSLISGGKTDTGTQLMDIMARAQEISRVSDLVVTEGSTSDTISLAKTTSSTLNSQKQQLSKYLTTHGVKVDPKKTASRLNKTTDDQFQTASQNNNVDSTYLNYLKTNLTDYSSAINSVYQKASKNLQPILKDDYTSTQQLLAAPQLK